MTKKIIRRPQNLSRRSLLAKALTGMGMSATTSAATRTITHDSAAGEERHSASKQGGYRETDHIRAYYESVRKSDP